ncbi:MAG: ComEA family DNA-binding protein [Methylococcaceae bacterium]
MFTFTKLLVSLGVLCGSMMVMAESLDINTATMDQFDQVMVGVGKSKAEAIIKDRETNGPFKSVDDLARVKGIGPATLQQNRDKLTTTPIPPAAPASPAPVANKNK